MLIECFEGNMRVAFRVNADRTVELVDFSGLGPKESTGTQRSVQREDLTLLPDDWRGVVKRHGVLGVQVTGRTTTDHGSQHRSASDMASFLYEGHEITENEKGRLLTLRMKTPEGLSAEYRMQFFAGLQIVRTEVTLQNDGTEPMGIEYVSSFFYGGLSKNGEGHYYDHTDLYVPRNSWLMEAQWSKIDVRDAGLSGLPTDGYSLPDKGMNRYHYGSNSSWSTTEYLPMGLVRNRDSGEIYYFEIEHSGSWEIEFGTEYGGNLYLMLLGPNDESGFWKNLQPGERFTTVPCAVGVSKPKEACIFTQDENGAMEPSQRERLGEAAAISEAVSQLTLYRRVLRRPNADDEKCHVVFNDYMNCLFGDPTEEKEKKIIDLAADLGCEYYCLDCGWYDDGIWWDRVGEWKEASSRFPNGLMAVCDYAHEKGLKMGLWLEIEVMGVRCELANRLPDDWFIMTHGKRRIDSDRYLLDFRNPAVRQYCSDTVDRLMRDFGVEYFKIDYNVTTGIGPDVNTDSLGAGMLEHVRCLYEWIRSVYAKHPDLVIENCGSGAQRQDYGILALHSLQSTSDQTDYIKNAYIGANVAAGVTPEQAGMWVYPYEDDREHVIWNVVNGLLLRPYMSGLVWDISTENYALMKEGVACYKQIRADVKEMVPFYPQGFHTVQSKVLAWGLRGASTVEMEDAAGSDRAYLAVLLPEGEQAEIDLGILGKPCAARVIYPKTEDCEYQLVGAKLHVKMPAEKCARLFEIEM